MNKIKFVLNNEIGSPMVESIIIIGAELCVIGGIYIFFKSVFDFIFWLSSITSFYEKK